jgi:hypothetical protein
VVAPAVGLYDQAEVGPEEIDLEAVDHVFGQRRRQPGRGGEPAEEAFQLVVGEAEGVLVEDVAEKANARLAWVIVEGAAQRVGVDHVELVGLVDRALDRLGSGDGGKVEEGADGPGDWDVQAKLSFVAG